MENSKGSGSNQAEGSHGKPLGFCIPDLVRSHARSTPDALALSSGSETLSYQELDHRSNQLANYLRGVGVVPGGVVGLCLERSLDFPVAALAILKAGCAYLPLEPKTPSRRLQTMLKEAQVSKV